MKDEDYPLDPTPSAEMDAPRESLLDPYVSFVGAFLHQVVTDARHPLKAPGDWSDDSGRGTPNVQRDAQAFLLDRTRLAFWVELTGADVDRMHQVLLHAAGLGRPPAG